MIPRRIAIKFFLKDPRHSDPELIVWLFNTWIQDQLIDDVLIDVVNYSHVPDGPGIILIGHETDYALDLTDGKAGLLVTLKRGSFPTLRDAIAELLKRAEKGIQLLESGTANHAAVVVDNNQFTITFLDRLQYPNATYQFDQVVPELEQAATEVLGAQWLEAEVVNEGREGFLSIRVSANNTSRQHTVHETASIER